MSDLSPRTLSTTLASCGVCGDGGSPATAGVITFTVDGWRCARHLPSLPPTSDFPISHAADVCVECGDTKPPFIYSPAARGPVCLGPWRCATGASVARDCGVPVS